MIVVDTVQTETTGRPAFEFSMTPQQRRIWKACASPTSRFNAAFRVEIAGPLNSELLALTIGRVVKRHEALRSCCEEPAGGPVIAVYPAETAWLSNNDVACLFESDLSCNDEGDRLRLLDKISADEACHFFDMSRAPLYRFHLIKLSEDTRVLTLTFHQILIDGWSVELIIEDIVAIYAALAAGHEPELPPPSLQLADYAEWLNTRLAEASVREEAQALLSELAEYKPFAISGEIKQSQSVANGNIIAFELSPDTASALDAVSKSTARTMFVIGASACLATLHRLTSQSEVAIGAPMTARNLPGLDQIVGTTVDSLLLRAKVAANTTLEELQEHIAAETGKSITREALPLDFLYELATERGNAIPDPLFTVAFVCQQAFGGRLSKIVEFAGCKLRTLPSVSAGALHDLFFFMVRRETGWRISLEYNALKIRDCDAQVYLESLRQMLLSAVRSPETAIADIALELPGDWRSVDRALDGADIGGVDAELQWPASLTQERYYYLTKLFPESSAFNLPACLHISGALNVQSLRNAIASVVARHEGLRTRLIESDRGLLQVIEPNASVELEVRDCPGDTSEALYRKLLDHGRQPFEIGSKSLLRLQLFVGGNNHNALLLTAHHAIADGHSMGLLIRELWAAYDGFEGARSAAPKDLAIQYIDYAEAQRSWLASSAAERQRSFWLQKLSAPVSIADIPPDRAPVPGQPSETAIEVVELSDHQWQRLREYCASRGLTAYQLTAAAFAVLIAEISGTSDVVFGSPIANRTDETQDVFGPFAGALPIRIDFSRCKTIRDVVQQSVQTIVDCFDNSQYPFELLLDNIEARSQQGRSPIFQLFFLYQVAYMTEIAASGLSITPGRPVEIDAPYELKFAFIQRTRKLELHVEFSSLLFDVSTIRNFITRYLAILSEIVEDATNREVIFRANTILPLAAEGEILKDAATAPQTDGERFLVEEFRTVLRQPSLSRQSSFFDVGGQSIAAVRLFRSINKKFGIDLAISTLLRHPTPAALAAYIDDVLHPGKASSGSSGSYRFLVQISEIYQSSNPPLYICAGAGGNVLNMRDVARGLAPDLSVVGIQARGLLASEQPHTNFENMAKDYLDEIRRFQPNGPYYLGGYSAGGIVAFEMARQLLAQGEQVGMVVLFDTILPSTTSLSVRDKIDWRMAKIKRNGLSDFVSTKLRRDFDGFRKALHSDERTWIERRLRQAISASFGSYQLRPYDGEVLLLRPPLEIVRTLPDGRAISPDGTVVRSDNFWSSFAKNLKVRVVGGNHYNFMEGENSSDLANTILREIIGARRTVVSATMPR